MPSFDIVSKFDLQEVENSVNMVNRDIGNRYDFRGSNSLVFLNKKENSISLESDSEMKINAVKDILEKRAIGRGVSIKTFQFGEVEKASGKNVKQSVKLLQGISKDKAKTINKLIKDSNLKVQSQIQEEQIRVTGKKIDDLQAVISLLNEKVSDIPLQYVNMKK
ncbi:MAG: YajQ family cyclic di-GMP-binding protein [Candidatus Marinimicrobia bacterium]|nr:YajQ family cyclic di-GMP-binding protein [Candidatus Neomarinimicrobiota bacterium]